MVLERERSELLPERGVKAKPGRAWRTRAINRNSNSDRKEVIMMICRKVWATNGWQKVNAWYDQPLKYMPHAQAGIVKNKYGIHLVSYTTRVISIDPNGWVDCTGTYSATTRKHIGAFLKEYAPTLNYYDMKRAFLGDYEININTGEQRSIFNRS